MRERGRQRAERVERPILFSADPAAIHKTSPCLKSFISQTVFHEFKMRGVAIGSKTKPEIRPAPPPSPAGSLWEITDFIFHSQDSKLAAGDPQVVLGYHVRLAVTLGNPPVHEWMVATCCLAAGGFTWFFLILDGDKQIIDHFQWLLQTFLQQL